MIASIHELLKLFQVVNLNRFTLVNLNRFQVVSLNRSEVVNFIGFCTQGSLIQKQSIQQMQEKVKLSIDAEAKGIYNVSLSDGYKMYYGKIVFE